MRILVTGATGVIGRAALPHLLAGGHHVTALARTEADARALATLGVHPVAFDLFAPDQVERAVRGNDAVINIATAMPPLAKMARTRAWQTNDQLRTHGSRNLVDAALRHDVAIYVQESITLNYADQGDRWLDEDAPLDPPFAATRSALDAEANAHRITQAGGAGIVLRNGRLYGPGRASHEHIALVRSGRNVVIGSGDNYVSSVHADDAGAAVAAALHAPPGAYNVVDDGPMTSMELAAALSTAMAARSPRRLPIWLARLVAGPGVAVLTVSQRVSNRRFRDATSWAPRFANARTGWINVAEQHRGVATP